MAVVCCMRHSYQSHQLLDRYLLHINEFSRQMMISLFFRNSFKGKTFWSPEHMQSALPSAFSFFLFWLHMNRLCVLVFKSMTTMSKAPALNILKLFCTRHCCCPDFGLCAPVSPIPPLPDGKSHSSQFFQTGVEQAARKGTCILKYIQTDTPHT